MQRGDHSRAEMKRRLWINALLRTFCEERIWEFCSKRKGLGATGPNKLLTKTLLDFYFFEIYLMLHFSNRGLAWVHNFFGLSSEF